MQNDQITEQQYIPPGTVIHIGERKLVEPIIHSIYYDREKYEKIDLQTLENWEQKKTGVNFLVIRGLHNVDPVVHIGEHLQLHALSIEDILHTESRNKLEEYPDYFLFVMRLPFLAEDGHIDSEQLSFILKNNLLAMFAESEKPNLSDLYDRLERGSMIRFKDTDDLLAALLDLMINQFFGVYDVLANRLDELEEKVVKDPETEDLENIHDLKKDFIHLREILWPMRESISSLSKSYINKVDSDTLYYMRDIEDHIVQLIQLGETYQEIATSLVDSYLSSISNKTNDVMKVLTIFSTIFIPLTFLAGVYGMNFKYMPELYQEWAYPMFWVICVVTIALLIIYFKKKDWL